MIMMQKGVISIVVRPCYISATIKYAAISNKNISGEVNNFKKSAYPV